MTAIEPDVRARVAAHLEAIARAAPRRPPGSAPNRAATAYVEQKLRAAGIDVDALPLRATFWTPGPAWLSLPDRSTNRIESPPFCPSARATGPALVVSSTAELAALPEAPNAEIAIVVLRDELVAEPFFPKAFPFVSLPEQVEIIATLERRRPAAVLAVVSDERVAEPIFEDPDLAFPYATVPMSIAGSIRDGDELRLVVEGSLDEGHGVNISGGQISGPRTVICAHIDSKVTTPGYLDNGGGVAALLAIAEAGLDALDPVELVFFNGEDHYAAPGEQAWLAARDLGEVRLVVNIDGAGLRGHRAAVSTIGATPELEARVARLIAAFPGLESGPPWYESDHAVFAMQGIPAVAITSAGSFDDLKRLAHDPADAIDRLDPGVLADVVRFVRALLAPDPGR